MRFFELQYINKEVIKLRTTKLLEDWEDIKKMFYYQNFL